MFNFLKKLFTKGNSTMEPALLNATIILDVRTSFEHKQGHVQGFKNIPVNEIMSKWR